jgi:hypothetical protein
MAQRSDLLAEVDTTFDGGGNYTGDWFDSGQIYTIRVIRSGGSSTTFEESIDQTHIVNSGTVTPGANQAVTARYFRITASGTPAAAYRAVIRVVP